MKKLFIIFFIALLPTTALGAGELKRFNMMGRGYIGNHFQDPENRELPPIVVSPFLGENYAQPMDTTSIYTASSSRLTGLDNTFFGATGYFLSTNIYLKVPYKFVTSGITGESIFSVINSNGALGRIFDMTHSASKSGVLQVFDKDSFIVPIASGSRTYSVGDKVVFYLALDMGFTNDNGTFTLQVKNADTGVLLETISGTGANFGDNDGAGETIGSIYLGRVQGRGGDLIGLYGESVATIDGFLPEQAKSVWMKPTTVGATNGWSISGTTNYVIATQEADSRSSAEGNYIYRNSGEGTGVGTQITYGFAGSESYYEIGSALQIYGVSACMDGWSDTSASTARTQIVFNYKGVDYTLTTPTQMNPFVLGDGGNPHTRCLGYFNETAGVYLGPDGLVWDKTALRNSTFGAYITNDTDGVNITGMMIGAYLLPNTSTLNIGSSGVLQIGNGSLQIR